MRPAWILPLAFHSLLALAAPSPEAEAKAETDLVYGTIKLTYTTPSHTAVSLVGLKERDDAEETASCLTKPSNLHTKSRTRARSHIRTCGEDGQTCLPSSTGVTTSKSVPSSLASSKSSSETTSSGASSRKSGPSNLSSSKAADYTTTVMTTIYETNCPGTKTVTSKGSTYSVIYASSTAVTETYTTVVPKSSSVAPVTSMVPVTYTTESTYFETKTITTITVVPCEGTYTYTDESTSMTTVFPSTTTTTTVITTKVPITSTITITKATPASHSTSVSETSVPGYPSLSSANAQSSSEKDYSTTIYNVVYTTTCPGTTTITSYGTTITTTYISTTVVNEAITKTYEAHSKHHSHSHHGHGSSSTESVSSSTSVTSESVKSVSSKASPTVSASSKASSIVSASSGASSIVSASSKASSIVSASSKASSTVSASSKASSVVSASSKASSVSASASIASKSASSSHVSSACSTPTPEPKCVPCEGQPGKDPKNFCGLTINDNPYKEVPKTCRTVVYDFVITNTTINPDGVERLGLLVNGQMPGPTIEAYWGDTIVVNVHNKMQDNGTSIHFHGQRQLNTNEMDGATSITQCPVPPGGSYTYKFVASGQGTSWYHSHFALQTYNGVFGPMIIHGPKSAEYDVDAGYLTLQDWTHATVDQTFDAAQTIGSFPEHGPRTMDLGLINGQNVWNGSGARYVLDTEFESGKSYLLRLINVANQATFKFYIDGHSLEVISNDYVPIKPYKTNIVNISPGQRYEVIVKADQTPGSYWIRSDNQDSCNAMTNSKDVKAVVNYKGFDSEPTSTAYTYTDECVDEPLDSLVPVFSIDAGAQTSSVSETILIGPGPNTPTLYKWTLSGSTFVSRWADPSLLELADNGTIPDYAGSLQLQYPNLGDWVYMVVQSPIPVPHPIHLHGHDFLIVGSGSGFYSGQSLNLTAPPRRDTALMPSAGYLVIAWQVDNPGSWLLHCHIAYHAAMGFQMEIVEGQMSDIQKTLTNSCQLEGNCKAWNDYATKAGVQDTGI